MVGLWPVRERVFTLRESEALGLACMVASSALFALMGLCVKLAGQSLPVEQITLVRAAGGLLVTTAMILVRPPGHPPRQVPWLLARGALGWAALVCYFQAIARLSLADAVFLNYTSPFFTAILAGWLLRERITPGMRLALVLGLGGVAVLVHPGGGLFQPGIVLGLGSGVLAAGAYVAVKRATAENDPLTIVWFFSLVATVLSVPLAWTHLERPSPSGWLAMGGVALTATVAQVLMTHGYRMARATPASIVSLFTPLFAALLGIVVFGDVPGWGTWIGGSLIVVAGILLARGSSST
jgi:drug/metabolite transporter (DMT)-like permease